LSIKTKLDNLLYGDEGSYAYLFPNRKKLPTITKHIFTDLKQCKTPLDQLIVSKLLGTNYIGWTAKEVLNLNLFPMQVAILQMIWNTAFPMIIASRGSSKSWSLAVYAILRALLDQGSKIVIVGAGLRQAKLVFNYIDIIWNNAPVLRSIIGGGKKAGPRQNVDLCYFKIGDSIIIALPLGDGSKIRGFRATSVLADEFACLDRNTLIETDNGLERISNITDSNTRVRNRYGEFESIDRFVKTPKTDVYEITTKYGYRFKCSNKHKVLTSNGWKLGKDLTSDDFLIIRNLYVFPSGFYDEFITEDMAWLIGLLIAEGTVTSKNSVGITTTDIDIVNRIKDKFGNLNLKVYVRDAHIDKRGWNCKKSYNVRIHNTEFRHKLFELGISYVKAGEKCIPFSILRSPKNIVVSFLSGLFEGDGSCFLWKDRQKTKLGIAYYTISDLLAQDVQTLLLKLDIIMSRRIRYSKISDKKQWILRANGKYALELAQILDIKKWNKVIQGAETHFRSNMYGVTFDKSRNKWMATILYGGKNNYLGRYINRIDAIQVVRKFIREHDECLQVQSVSKLGYQDNLYDFCLPLTHSFYGIGFVQHNSIPEDVFDIVVRGFAASSKAPVEEAKRIALNKRIANLGIPSYLLDNIIADNQKIQGNQIVYSGTAYYAFNHFAQKYRMWKNIISSKGDPDKIAQIFGGKNLVPDNFDYRDYSIMRIPYTYVPDGLLDKRQLAHAKATLPKNIFLMEFGAIFVKDSDGFFARSLIEGCTVGPNKPIDTPDGEVTFNPLMAGKINCKYVMGVDPAAERDNFAIVILEVWPSHYRIVYCWAVNKKEFIKRKKQGLITDDDYYAYCCSKIHSLVKLFKVMRIEMDSQGGGYAVAEMLRNKKLISGFYPIYEVIDFDDPKPTDSSADGKHILHLVRQTPDFNQDANVALHKSFETRTLLFPAFDSVKMYTAMTLEKSMNVIFDTYEDNVFNIEELKNELCTIQMTQTTTGKEKFDTPRVANLASFEGRTRKGRLHKDRYTALLLCHKYIYDADVAPVADLDYDVPGNIIKNDKISENEPLYKGPGVGQLKNNQYIKRGGGPFGAVKRGHRIK